jgi:1-deoxy-D-xylulose-5-phosphate reductoisomerase
MVHSISILGSTGSIGKQTVDVAEHLGLRVRALTALSNIDLLEKQARQLKPELVAVYSHTAAEQLSASLSDTGIRVLSGMEGLLAAAELPDTDCVVTAVSGAVGLRPTLAAIRQGKRIALANKETLVCAGTLVMAEAQRWGAEILPVDSEHSAIFQCLAGREKSELRTILLTGSGGPFRGMSLSETVGVTPAQAVSHPTWNMGAKISVDSATMMNKGLEFIEAMHLFGCTPEQIHVVIHPQSVVHSMVELIDGSVIAQMGVSDMRLPIQYALTYPERRPAQAAPLDLAGLGHLEFYEPDFLNTPCLRLAIDCAKTGGTAPCILSAANEVAVSLFLNGWIGFNDIYLCVQNALDSIDIIQNPTLDQILAADQAARDLVSARKD